MLEMTRRTMLAGTLASTPGWPHPKPQPAMPVADVATCVRHAFELAETDAWLVGQRLVWSTGGPRRMLTGMAATIRASAMMRGGLLNTSHTVPGEALLALYDGGSPSGVWRPASGGTVSLCGVRMAAFASQGRAACLVQPSGVPIPTEIVLNG